MQDAITDLVNACHWKIMRIIGARRYYNEEKMILLYKSNVLGYIESKTSGVYHACKTALYPLNKVQKNFLDILGVTELDALLKYNLAPSQTRRDLAMIAVIHKTVIEPTF